MAIFNLREVNLWAEFGLSLAHFREKHKLPMNLIFLPCHFSYYDFIIHFGIL